MFEKEFWKNCINTPEEQNLTVFGNQLEKAVGINQNKIWSNINGNIHEYYKIKSWLLFHNFNYSAVKLVIK